MNTSSLPLKRDISTAYALSIIVVLLMSIMSLVGLFFQSSIYRTEELRYSSVATDVVNLFIVLPVLLGSMSLARRGKLIGLLFWPGALFIVTYHYLAYAAGLPTVWQFAVYLTLVFLSVYTIFNLISSVDSLSIQEQLTPNEECSIPGEKSFPAKLAASFIWLVLISCSILYFSDRFLSIFASLFSTIRLSFPFIRLLLRHRLGLYDSKR